MNQKTALAFSQVQNALIQLEQTVYKPVDPERIIISACIQRFEFTIELFWKLLKRILADQGVEVIYPREVLQQAYAGHLIDDETTWLGMVNDRNLISHTYNETKAEQMYTNIKIYYPTLKSTFDTLSMGEFKDNIIKNKMVLFQKN